MDLNAGFRTPRGSNANARLCRNARDCHGGIRQELAAGMKESPGCAGAFKSTEGRNTLEGRLWFCEIKDAIGSIVGNRHLIAHGRDTTLTISRVSEWLKRVRDFIAFLESKFS